MKNASSLRRARRWPINPHEITAVILARDEERRLPHVVASLPPGIRLLVIDSGSIDRTCEVAAELGAVVLKHAFEGFVSQRRYALSNVVTPWAFMVDADEVLDERLRDAIVAASGDADGYTVSRTTYYCGKPMRLWSGEQLVRLFRTDRARVLAAPAAGGNAELHERWICDGRVERLDGTLEHYSYVTRAAYAEKFERYTDAESTGVRGSVLGWMTESLKTYPRFTWYALRRGSLLDGIDGVRVAWSSARYPAVVQWKALRRGRS